MTTALWIAGFLSIAVMVSLSRIAFTAWMLPRRTVR